MYEKSTLEIVIEQTNADIENLLQCKLCEDVSLRAFGIASTVQVFDEEDEKSIPAVILNNGDCEYVFSDDDFQAGCYHRINSKTYGTVKGGGNFDKDVETVEMVLIVWGFSNQLKMSNLDFERDVIIPAIPQRAKLVSTDFDSYRVANSEFKGINYIPKPEEFIFSVKYRVQYAFERKCLKKNCS